MRRESIAAALACALLVACKHAEPAREHAAAPPPPPLQSLPPARPKPPPPTAVRRPNIVLIEADDQRADSLQCMPKLNRLLGKGVTFAWHFAATPLCCPARTTQFTGQYAHNHGVRTNGDREEGEDERVAGAVEFVRNALEHRVLPKWLQDAGYRTAFFGKYLNGYDELLADDPGYVPPHWDDWHAFPVPGYFNFQLIERRHDQTTAERVCYASSTQPLPRRQAERAPCDQNVARVERGREHYSTDVLSELAGLFLQERAGSGQPFFLYFAPWSPHAPYQSPGRYQPDPKRLEFSAAARERLAGCKLFDWNDRPPSYLEADVSDKPSYIRDLAGTQDEHELERLRKMQLASVLATEDAVEVLMRALETSGEADNTVIIYVSDNGYAWGEHGYARKNCAYDECSHVPLVIYDPRRASGGVRTTPGFSMDVDLAPTILGLANVAPPADVRFDGMSLVPLLDGVGNWPRTQVLTECWGTGRRGHPDVHAAVRTKDWKYVEHYAEQAIDMRGGPRESELYDLQHDPYELDNLLALPGPALRERGYQRADVRARAQSLQTELTRLKRPNSAAAAAAPAAAQPKPGAVPRFVR